MQNTVLVNFATFPFCFRTTTVKDFTNKLIDEKEFACKFKDLYEKLLPHVNQKTFEELMNERFHCHPIRKNDVDKIDLINKIVGNLVEKWKPGIDVAEFLKQNLDGEKIWQLGNNSIRLIGIRKERMFDVLFIDYHHLIYPSIKYNEKEYTNNNFGIIEYAEVEHE